jgi:RNA polymerase sigma factor (sigma-70 family)
VETFDDQWRAARPVLQRYCLRATRSHADAEDLFGHVALRVFRGYPGFRGDCSFQSWALRIAEREASRYRRRLQRRLERETPLELPVHDLPEPAVSGAGTAPTLDLTIVRCAAASGDLTAAEHRVLDARLRLPGKTWAELAPELGTTANACAVAHCRAVPKLRVHAVTHHADQLGRQALRAALEAARTAGPLPLTQVEAAVFADVVLDGHGDHRARGRRTALRGATSKVLAQMPRVLNR